MTTCKRNLAFDDNYMKTISNNIRKYRLEAGIIQEQLAIDIGLSYDFVRRLEFKKGKLVAH